MLRRCPECRQRLMPQLPQSGTSRTDAVSRPAVCETVASSRGRITGLTHAIRVRRQHNTTAGENLKAQGKSIKHAALTESLPRNC